jgi:hypothetical protein
MSAKWAAQLLFLLLFLVYMAVRDNPRANQCACGEPDRGNNASGRTNGRTTTNFFNRVLVRQMLARMKRVLGRAPKLIGCLHNVGPDLECSLPQAARAFLRRNCRRTSRRWHIRHYTRYKIRWSFPFCVLDG